MALVMAAAPLQAATWSFKSETALEVRQFTDDDDAVTHDAGVALFTRLEASLRHRGWRGAVRGFGRYDVEDEDREIYAIEEAWLGWRQRGLEIRAGYQMLNWTATEAFHPADMINSRNFDSNIENAEKLGELMLSVSHRLGRGGLTLYYMPRFEEPNLPGVRSRLKLMPSGFTLTDALLQDNDNAELTDDFDVTQWGGRFTQTIGDIDFSFHYVDHIERNQPRVLPLDADQFPDPDGTELTPIYQRVIDSGGTYLQVAGAWIFKLELSHKNFVKPEGFNVIPLLPDHTQAAFGIEYGWTGPGGADAVLIFEGQNVFGPSEERRAQLTAFQRDMLVGYSHAWNDRMDRQLLVTTIIDVERSQEYLVNARYSQRLSDTWKITAGARYVDAPQKEEDPIGLEVLDESNQVFLTLSKFL
ncbi:hypothetical protein [Sulfidibacter corallicola]|uniref:Porin n=1 Tax=Sulfidibacter corallicola TaxID=2818388 RepID=A0A8A4TG27_SULCO|nr:hypothetical protein [Sulfidibacter corallicola]QTD48510.1 hypothetical protein J3U87_23265 [Sulfidibacter corallicola]